MAECPKVAFPFRGRWLSVKTLAFLPKDGRGRSPGRKHANQRYRRGDDLFRPRCARPPSPEGEGFWMRQQLFLIPNPYSLIPARQLDKSEVPSPLSHHCPFSSIPAGSAKRPALRGAMSAGAGFAHAAGLLSSPLALVCPGATPSVLSRRNSIASVANSILMSSTMLGLDMYIRSICSLS